MISLDLIREHCRADPEDVSEGLLTSYRDAAVRLFERRTGRVLVVDVSSGASANALKVEGDVLVALLMLIDHWVSHKGVATDVQLMEVPMGAKQVMDLYRSFFE
ncbi:head-tail connector protein [Paracandidimonas soli]|uniref:Gp6-like head-tail connector protein n=1 Tax=Paracandidimonas soli TaxID=1917182 RepID=A0A4R3US68_9BURK|nr:head-tail connector protein [Paracandidimonas soli]TCU93942.1 gp6-like head-tail connector protein [Paracandidimonas soli]